MELHQYIKKGYTHCDQANSLAKTDMFALIEVYMAIKTIAENEHNLHTYYTQEKAKKILFTLFGERV